MLYQYKNFRTKEMVGRKIKKESAELLRIVILLVILNLVLMSLYWSEKKKYDDRKMAESSFCDKKRTEEERVEQDKVNAKNQIVKFINNDDLLLLCRHIDYSNNCIKLECSPDKFDELYNKINNTKCFKQNEVEGDSSKIVLKSVLK